MGEKKEARAMAARKTMMRNDQGFYLERVDIKIQVNKTRVLFCFRVNISE